MHSLCSSIITQGFPEFQGMVKAKQRKQAPDLQNESLDPHAWSEMDSVDDWVIVKKQRVTILLPPLPVVEQALAPNLHPKPMDGSFKSNVGKKHLYSEELVPQEQQSQPPDQLLTEKLPKSLKTSKSSMEMRRFSCCCSFPDGCSLMKQKLRAQNLERKLKRAGGLSRWLLSLGLGQFVRIFEHRSVGKFQLTNLTMNKLKDMGAVAVGPRRKLMHALDCCCGP